MELPGVLTNGLLNEEEEKWNYKPIKNLDHFFTSFYQYYINKGLHQIILTQLCDVIALGFTLGFSIFLLFYVKWNHFNNCRDELSCGTSISDYIISSPFEYHNILTSLFMIIFIILSIIFWIWQLLNSLQTITDAIEMNTFYMDKLGLSMESLQYLKWNEIVEELIKLHESGKYKVVATDKLTEETIILRIMRKENYLIALINKQLLDLRVPWWMRSFLSENLFLTKSLEWSLSFCILDYIFTENFEISLDFLRDKKLLERRFFITGIVNFILLPFILIFMIIHFFFQNVQQFHSNKTYLGPREWSPLAVWTMRDFNELPHIFEERMQKSYQPANIYISLFHNSYYVILARLSLYISGSFIAVLLLISLISEGVLLFVHVSEHNLLWYLGIFTAIYAASRSIIPENTIKTNTLSADELLQQISSHTYYYPDSWIGKGKTIQVCNEFKELFPFKVQIFGMEVMSVILTPVVLCFSLPNCAEVVINFIKYHSKFVDGVGAVCDYSLMDVAKYGNERYGAPMDGSVNEVHRPNDGKLEQSYLNFRQHYPHWEGNETGRIMEENLHYYKFGKEYDRETQINNLLHNSYNMTKSMNRLSNSTYSNKNKNIINKEDNITSNIPIPIQTSNILSNIRNTFTKPKSNYTPISTIEETEINDDNSNSDSIVLDNDKSMNIHEEESTGKKIRGNWGNNSNNLDNNRPNVGLFPGRWSANGYESNPIHNNINVSNINTNDNNNNLSLNYDHNDVNQFIQSRYELPKALRTILDQDNIDYHNASYWLTKFRKDKVLDPSGFERSFTQSKLLFSEMDLSETLQNQLINGSLLNSTSIFNNSPPDRTNFRSFGSPSRMISPYNDQNNSPLQHTIHYRKKDSSEDNKKNNDLSESV